MVASLFGSRSALIGIPGPVGDPAQFLGAGEGGEGYIGGVVAGGESGGGGIRRAPPVGIERH